MGRSTAIDRPILYGTTDVFLKYFGFENLKDLPDIGNLDGLNVEAEEAVDNVDLQQISLELPEK